MKHERPSAPKPEAPPSQAAPPFPYQSVPYSSTQSTPSAAEGQQAQEHLKLTFRISDQPAPGA